MPVLSPHERKALRETVFQRFFEAAEIANFTPNEMRDYRESQKEMWDMYSITTTAENKGLKRGREEGRAEGLVEGEAIGMKKGKTDSARNLKSLGIPLETIAQATGLTIEEIEQL